MRRTTFCSYGLASGSLVPLVLLESLVDIAQVNAAERTASCPISQQRHLRPLPVVSRAGSRQPWQQNDASMVAEGLRDGTATANESCQGYRREQIASRRGRL